MRKIVIKNILKLINLEITQHKILFVVLTVAIRDIYPKVVNPKNRDLNVLRVLNLVKKVQIVYDLKVIKSKFRITMNRAHPDINLMIKSVKINDYKLSALIDTGSPLNLLSFEFYKRLNFGNVNKLKH